MPPPYADVVVSNGFNKFHLALAAAELEARGRLGMLVTGAYPTGPVLRLVSALGLGGNRKLRRLLDRGVPLPDGKVAALPGAEALAAAGVALLQRRGLAGLGGWLDRAGFRAYARLAARVLERRPAGPGVYHYRAGFGLGSVAVARRKGMVTLCDHSIAHPQMVDHLVAHGGRLPDPGSLPAPSPLWRLILDDIAQADHVLVNSDFVRDTFLHAGWPAGRLDVAYLGIDEGFLAALPPVPPPRVPPDTLLFAGTFDRRKGADVLAQALGSLPDPGWRLELVGPVPAETERRLGPFLADKRVSRRGVLGRADLAACLAAHRVMVFPSLAEGSARIVMEAMAAGCLVITTPNAGSLVRDGIDGFLVPPGDPVALAGAIARALALGTGADAIGAANAARIRDHHRQANYGDALCALYDRLLGQAAGGRP